MMFISYIASKRKLNINKKTNYQEQEICEKLFLLSVEYKIKINNACDYVEHVDRCFQRTNSTRRSKIASTSNDTLIGLRNSHLSNVMFDELGTGRGLWVLIMLLDRYV